MTAFYLDAVSWIIVGAALLLPVLIIRDNALYLDVVSWIIIGAVVLLFVLVIWDNRGKP